MLSNKWEGRIVVIEGDIIPTAGRMAGAAIGAKLPVVIVVGSMTGIAVGWRALIDTIGMTVATGQITMLPHQWETRIGMIKGRAAPATGRMTGSAIGSELSVVMIIGSMTGETIFWSPFEHIVCMTGFAVDIIVLPCQRETRIRVIEGYIAPTTCVMTSHTIGSKLPVVVVIRSMAGKAIFGCAFEFSI